MSLARALVVAVLAASVLTGCETTQDTNDKLAVGAKNIATERGLKIVRANPSVRATETEVVHDATGTAAVVWLRNSGAAQAGIPVAISLTDRNGKAVYANDLAGLDVSLTSIAAVPSRANSFWVNDQIQAPTVPKRVVAKIGAAKRAAVGTLPKLEITRINLERDTDGAYALGVVANRSKIDQLRLVISCVSRRAGKVVAAGRSIVERLAPAPTPKPVSFRVYFIGNPSGGRLLCSAPPTVVPGGSS